MPQKSDAWRQGLAAAAITCNINTGKDNTGATCASPAATCNGVADDASAFQAFNTWAKATTANSNGQTVELDVSGHCMFLSGDATTNSFWKGIKNGRMIGYGTILTASGGGAYSLGGAGICHFGLSDPSGCSARVATVTAGASSVTLLDTSLCSRFTAGRWAVVTGLDLQGTFNVPGGFPPNPAYHDYVQIASTSNCGTTGQITFSSALSNTYLQTWPNYNSGNALEADAGGPATIYALDSSWDTALDIRGITIDQSGQTGAGGRSIIFRDITVTGVNCLIPSQNSSFTIINGTMTSCDIEADKLVDTYTLTNVTTDNVTFQSSSITNFVASNSTFTTSINGTPRIANISNSTMGTLKVGPLSNGTALSASCTNCNITTAIGISGPYKASGDVGANVFYSMGSGVLSAPDTVAVTGFANNGSGAVRLTVGSTTGWATNAGVSSKGIFASGPNSDGPQTITVVDGTHIDLQGTTFSGSVWTGSGSLNNAAPPWAVPGTNVFFGGQLETEASAFQVTGVTQNGSGTHIATSLAGGFPTLPLTSGKLYLQVQTPKFTCSGCTGIADAVDFGGAPANIPIYSYSKRTYSNSTALSSHEVWGKVTSIKFNVTQAYTGSTSPLTFTTTENTVIPAGTTSFYGAVIDLRTAGLRTVTPSGVTCDTGGGPIAGGCGADSGLTLPDPAAFFGTSASLSKSASPVDQPWSMSIEFIMDQGVVAP